MSELPHCASLNLTFQQAHPGHLTAQKQRSSPLQTKLGLAQLGTDTSQQCTMHELPMQVIHPMGTMQH